MSVRRGGFLALVFALVVAAGPRAWADDGYTPHPLSPPVTVAMSNSDSILLVPLYIAIERGYFRDEGINVDFVGTLSTPEQVTQLAAGHLQMGYGGPEPGLFNAVNRGITIKIVAPLESYERGNAAVGFVVRQDLLDSGRYKSFKDLKGMNVAVVSPASAKYYLHLALRKVGLDLADVNPAFMGFSDMAAALASKRIDAAEESEPAITRLEAAGTAKDVLPLGDLAPGIRPISLLASGAFASDNPEALRHFLIAFSRANFDYWHAFVKKDRPNDQAAIIQILTKYAKLNDPKAYEDLASHHGLPDISPNASVDVQSLDDMQQFYLKEGTQLQPVDLSKVVDNSYLRDALKRLGAR